MWGRCSGGGSRPRPQHCTGIALCTFCNFHCSLLHSSYNLGGNKNPPRVGNGNTQCAIICSAPPLIRVLAPLTGEYAVIYCYHQWSATTEVIIIMPIHICRTCIGLPAYIYIAAPVNICLCVCVIHCVCMYIIPTSLPPLQMYALK